MRAIPLNLLQQECVLKHKIGQDRNRNSVYEERILVHVRIGATFQTVRGSIGETKADTLTMFIDAANTEYETTEGETTAQVLPTENDAVTWNGKDYTVRSVTPCFTQGDATPHHWEVTLE